MKRRLITVLLVMSVLGLAGCGNTVSSDSEDKVQDSVTTEAEQAHTEVDEAVDSKVDYMAFQGEYQDRVSQRATATVRENPSKDSVNIEVRWSSSATESAVWVMDAAFEYGCDDKLIYNNCQHSVETYTEGSDEPQTEVVYADGAGSFDVVYENDHYVLKWAGAADDNCKTCEFVNVEAMEQTDDTGSGADTDAGTEGDNDVTHKESGADGRDLTGADLDMDLSSCLASMYGIHPGTAGTSLRAEAAAEEFATLVKNYSGKVSKEEICNSTKEWMEITKEDNPYIKDDMMECLEDMIYYVENKFKDTTADVSYQDFTEGLREAVQ